MDAVEVCVREIERFEAAGQQTTPGLFRDGLRTLCSENVHDAATMLEMLAQSLVLRYTRVVCAEFQAMLSAWAKSRAVAVAEEKMNGDSESDGVEARFIGLEEGRMLMLNLTTQVGSDLNQLAECGALHPDLEARCNRLTEELISAVRSSICEGGSVPCFRPLLLYITLESHKLHQVLGECNDDGADPIAHPIADAGCVEVWKAIHMLGLPRVTAVASAITHVPYKVLKERLDKEFSAFAEEDAYEPLCGALTEWREQVADPFVVHTVVEPNCKGFLTRAQIDTVVQRAEELQAHIYTTLAERYFILIFQLMFHFPENIGALGDLRECLSKQRGLVGRLMTVTKAALFDSLHNPGTKSESILRALISGVKAFCFLLRRSEQGPVIQEVFSETLQYYRARKDAAEVLMRALIDPTSEAPLQTEMQTYATKDTTNNSAVSPQRTGRSGGDDRTLLGEGDDTLRVSSLATEDDLSLSALQKVLSSLRRRQGQMCRGSVTTKYIPPPHLLELLFSAVPISAVIKAFEQYLVQSLLDTRIPGNETEMFETLEFEATVERLKRVFGDDELLTASIVIRDVKDSRRNTAAVHDILRRGTVESSVMAEVVAISATRWPALDPNGVIPPFEVHPSLDAILASYAAAYTQFNPTKEVFYQHSHGTVSLKVTQLNGGELREVPFKLVPFLATVVLHLFDLQREHGGCTGQPMHFPLKDVLDRMGLDGDDEEELYFLIRLAEVYEPTLFVLDLTNYTVALQTVHQGSD